MHVKHANKLMDKMLNLLTFGVGKKT